MNLTEAVTTHYRQGDAALPERVFVDDPFWQGERVSRELADVPPARRLETALNRGMATKPSAAQVPAEVAAARVEADRAWQSFLAGTGSFEAVEASRSTLDLVEEAHR